MCMCMCMCRLMERCGAKHVVYPLNPELYRGGPSLRDPTWTNFYMLYSPVYTYTGHPQSIPAPTRQATTPRTVRAAATPAWSRTPQQAAAPSRRRLAAERLERAIFFFFFFFFDRRPWPTPVCPSRRRVHEGLIDCPSDARTLVRYNLSFDPACNRPRDPSKCSLRAPTGGERERYRRRVWPRSTRKGRRFAFHPDRMADGPPLPSVDWSIRAQPALEPTRDARDRSIKITKSMKGFLEKNTKGEEPPRIIRAVPFCSLEHVRTPAQREGPPACG